MKIHSLIFYLLLTINCFSQNTIPEVLKKFNKESVPYITVSQLKTQNNSIILDTREPKEFNTSHIANSQNVGYEKFNSKKIKATFKNQNQTIIVYCSVGIRSEIIGEKLLKMGYKNVFNLYGGIFEWKNQGEVVVDKNQKKTDNIHTFSSEWSKYLLKGTKIFEK
ncbi:rhodanese-like domain-containing protein [Flavobacterium sp.]|uniref:rhodanese-like domain-containing protein n=1 Tax=Flavobacterium sp. TaxID=239 RepID=UPI00286D7C42|nr:rhodanese-like domain-containing protein [Flavobacterium sp.]